MVDDRGVSYRYEKNPEGCEGLLKMLLVMLELLLIEVKFV